MAYTGRAPSAAPLTSGDITDGAVAPVDLSTGAPSWDTSGNLTVDGGAVFNEAGADVDFRVESDTNTHALFLEGSSGNVGIGTSSPSAQLHVQNSSGNSTSILGQYGTGTRAEVTAASNEVVFKAYNGTNDVMAFYTGASERMRIDSSGNVGIGTTDFSQPAKVIITGANAGLTVGDSVEIFRVGDGRGNSASDGLRLSAVRDTTAGSYGDWHTQTLRLERNIDNVAPQSGIDFSPSILKLRTSGAERMRIDSSGNVGVGTSSPSTKLHLEGTDSSPTALRLTNTTASTGKSWQITSTNAGLLQLATIPGVADYLTVNSSGNVGIGTSSPTASVPLTIVSNSGNAIAQNIRGRSDGIGVLLFSDNSDVENGRIDFRTNYAEIKQTRNAPLVFSTNNTERMRIDSSGNVGIGVSTGMPSSYDLCLRGNNALRWQHATAGTQYGDVYVDTSSNIVFRNGASSTERMRIDSSGNLKFNSGYGSVATAYGCRAWANFNGTGSLAVLASGGISSISDGGTGDYTVNFASAMPDANYSVSKGVCQNNDGGNDQWNFSFKPGMTKSTSAFNFITTRGGSPYDSANVSIAFHR